MVSENTWEDAKALIEYMLLCLQVYIHKNLVFFLWKKSGYEIANKGLPVTSSVFSSSV